MHLELRKAHEEPRARVTGLVLLVVPDHVADVLTEEALDALVEFLAAVDVHLGHPVKAVGIPRAGLEGGDQLGDLEVVRDVGDQVTDDRKGAHRRDRDGLVRGQCAHPGHAHQPGPAVDLGAAGAALARLAVPPDGQVRCLGRLDTVDDVEHDLALLRRDVVVLEPASVRIPPPQAHHEVFRRRFRGGLGSLSRGRFGVDCHQCAPSSKSFASSSGICGLGSLVTYIFAVHETGDHVDVLEFSA